MTTATPTQNPGGQGHKGLSHLTFGGVLNSEWIKLRTLRSTVWCYAILVVLTIAIGVIIALNANGQGHPTGEAARMYVVSLVTVGVTFGQLVVAVLGTLVITGEYGTGMIRSTLAAVPKRTPALVAKVLVFGVVTFVVSLISMVITALIVTPILSGVGISFSLVDPRIVVPVLGAAGALALVGVMALALGAIIRNSAGGLAASLGLLLVAPIILGLVYSLTQSTWALNVSAVIPGTAADRMRSYVASEALPTQPGVLQLEPWQGGLVLFAWFAVFFVIAAVLLKRRDA